MEIDNDEGNSDEQSCDYTSYCVLCGFSFGEEKRTKLTEKGKISLRRHADERDDSAQQNAMFLQKKMVLDNLKFNRCYIHEDCRRHYIKRPTGEKTESINPDKKLRRSSTSTFAWKDNCFLCSEPCTIDTKHPDRNPFLLVRTFVARQTLLLQCDLLGSTAFENQNTELSIQNSKNVEIVRSRLLDCHDLVAVEARYHVNCDKIFRKSPSSESGSGRPKDIDMDYWFLSLCEWLETVGDVEVFSVNELYEQMCQLAGGAEVYSEKWFKQQLKHHYGDHVYFSHLGGSRQEVVCFRDMVTFIVSENWYQQRKDDKLQESERIITTAARIIREEIREKDYSKEHYPNPYDLRSAETCRNFLAPSLLKLLETLMKPDLKSVAIGQAITQAMRPRSVISPLLFGLGVEMDLKFGSRWLIDELYALGFSPSYDEIASFKQAIIQDESFSNLSSPMSCPIQFVADNADANIGTLDGYGTFHGLGTIRVMKRKHRLDSSSERVKRIARVKVSELIKEKGIEIRVFETGVITALSKVKFKPIIQLMYPWTRPPQIYYSNLLWQSSQLLRKTVNPTPHWLNWNGFMQHVFRHDEVDEDDITILPLIDLDPADSSTLYSCIMYIDNEIKKLGLKETTLTFDQPLYIKAEEIVRRIDLKTVVIRLGGFHTMMSAVGSIFYIMRGSGIEEALNCIYGANTIVHIMSGKAISRALRAIHLIDAALSFKLMELILPRSSDGGSLNELEGRDTLSEIPTDLLVDLQSLLVECLDDKSAMVINNITSSSSLKKLDDYVENVKKKLSISRTASLWLQFQKHVDILKSFIASERLKHWEGHLNATLDLLNLFAASGHVNYAKCARLYLQNMRSLSENHPDLYKLFTEQGFHAVQRSDHVFNGLWTDLVIEQVLMRGMKIRGGLTHGRGLTESVRQLWVYTMHHCAQFHIAMTDLTGKLHKTSEQHTDLSEARRSRDSVDLQKLVDWFDQNNPYDPGVAELQSLASGLSAKANDGINCDEAENVGRKIQMEMDNVSFADAQVKRSLKVKTLDDMKPSIKIGGKSVHIDPTVLFLRCTAVAKRLDEDIEKYFEYELSSEPASLFKDGFMRHAEKSNLADEILEKIPTISSHNAEELIILDGGWLVNKLRWRKGNTYRAVIDQYRTYVKSHFGHAVIIFDGYKSSTKDHEHRRRRSTVKKTSRNIVIKPDNIAYEQNAFLANESNKQSFICNLASALEKDGHSVECCEADADVTLVKRAIQYAQNGQAVTVVANDTDILIILIHHFDEKMSDIKLHRETSARKQPLIHNIRDVCRSLPCQVKSHILFAHAWSGCDTTSHIHSFGKPFMFKMLKSNAKMCRLAGEIERGNKMSIQNAGCKIFAYMYSGDESESLTHLRQMKYKTMMTDKNTIDVPWIPPTNAAAQFHALRVHLQVQVWTELNDAVLDPCSWGWKKGDQYEPVGTELPPAPENILNFVRCRCKAIKNQCGALTCSCRKNGLKCVDVCGGCHGENCKNSEKVDLED